MGSCEYISQCALNHGLADALDGSFIVSVQLEEDFPELCFRIAGVMGREGAQAEER